MKSKWLKTGVLIIAGVLAPFLLMQFLLSQTGQQAQELSAIMVRPDTEFKMVKMKHPTGWDEIRFIARQLDSLAAIETTSKFGLELDTGTLTIFAMVNREKDTLEIRRKSSSGTIIQTLWPKAVLKRLEWARKNNSFQVPGLPGKTERNLYH